MKKAILHMIILSGLALNLNAQEQTDTVFHRHYELGIAPSNDLDNVYQEIV